MTHPHIAGLPDADSQRLLQCIQAHAAVQRVLLYGSRALGRQRSGSDVDLCLEAEGMTLAKLLELGAELDNLLLPWRIDLQVRHLIDHEAMLDQIYWAGLALWERDHA